MKGTEKIIAHIRADAQAQSDAILAQAEQQCAGIRADFESKAKSDYAERIRSGVKECQDRLDSMERITRMEAKKSILSLKQEMVSESFDMALDMLVNLPQEQYVEFLAKLAAKASTTKDEEIVLNARDRAAVGELLISAVNEKLGGAALTLSDTVGSFAGGLILRRGAVEANCTAELLVGLCRDSMSAELAGILFE